MDPNNLDLADEVLGTPGVRTGIERATLVAQAPRLLPLLQRKIEEIGAQIEQVKSGMEYTPRALDNLRSNRAKFYQPVRSTPSEKHKDSYSNYYVVSRIVPHYSPSLGSFYKEAQEIECFIRVKFDHLIESQNSIKLEDAIDLRSTKAACIREKIASSAIDKQYNNRYSKKTIVFWDQVINWIEGVLNAEPNGFDINFLQSALNYVVSLYNQMDQRDEKEGWSQAYRDVKILMLDIQIYLKEQIELLTLRPQFKTTRENDLQMQAKFVREEVDPRLDRVDVLLQSIIQDLRTKYVQLQQELEAHQRAYDAVVIAIGQG